MTVNHSALLEQCLLLQSLAHSDLEVVVDKLCYEDFAAGDEVLTEGLIYHGLWILLEGRCEVVRGLGTKHPSQLAVLEPGAVFGEMSFLTDQPHSATVRALSVIRTARITKDNFVKLEASHPSIAQRIINCVARVMADRLRKMDEWICQLVERDKQHSHQGEWREFRAKLYSDWQM